uniref:LY6/PLAUR domain containing 6B n=1 Tax=Spermophilus dauricus TaxID=99837 RepID=A0A8C9NZ57_SPEDA
CCSSFDSLHMSLACSIHEVRMLLLCQAVAVAVVHIFILSENWASAKNINFYNVRPPLDPTPFPNSFKCFTCENAGDNYNCNRWAEDKWCPQNTQYCLTVHHFTSHGRSTSITKKCASKSECHFVGCHHSQDSEHTVRSCVCRRLHLEHFNSIFGVFLFPRVSFDCVIDELSGKKPLADCKFFFSDFVSAV